jgi:hypothetical protein
MSDTLLNILKALSKDPTLAIELYREIFESSFFSFVRNGTEENWNTLEFLTYDTSDDIKELPLFTHKTFVFMEHPFDAIIVEVFGESLWDKLLNIVETGKCEAAINPGQSFGIRLTREMILGMVSKYRTSLDDNKEN